MTLPAQWRQRLKLPVIAGGIKAPKSIDFGAQLPRGPVGKVLKRELRQPYWSDKSSKI